MVNGSHIQRLPNLRTHSGLFVFLSIVMLAGNVRAQHSARLMHGSDTLVFGAVDERTFELSYRLANNLDTATIIFDANYHPSGVFTRVDSDANGLHIRGGAYSIEATTSPFVITVRDVNDRVIFATAPDSGFRSNGCYAQILQHADYYGLDNRPWDIVRGNWPTHVHSGDQGNGSGLLVWTTAGFGILGDIDDASVGFDPGAGIFSYSKQESHRKNNVLVISMGAPNEIFSSYSTVLGKATMPPLWALGFIHCKWGQDQALDLSLADEYRRRNMPVDVFMLDFEWMNWGEPWGEFRWNPKSFPGGSSGAFADSMRTRGIALVGIRKPRIHTELPEGVYATEHHYLRPDPPSDDYVSKKPTSLVDFFDSAARAWYWQLLSDSATSPFISGIQGFWNDETGYSRSLYGTYMQKAQYDGQRAMSNQRVFSLNRNYFVGSNKFGYGLWTGDIQSSFAALRDQSLSVLTSADLGDGWWSMDIGGFWGASDSSDGLAELYTRWMEFGAFVPFYRIHSIIDHQREPWYYGVNAATVSGEFIRLRHTFIPYLYGAFRSFVENGTPPVRPLVFDYPTVQLARSERYAFMYGPSILVAPVVDSLARSANFYLPPRQWVNFWDDSIIDGDRRISMSAPLDRIPILIKRGAIIPERLPGRFALDTESFKDIRFHVYSGASDSTNYYEDDFNTYDYEKGVFATIPYVHTYTSDTEHIVIGAQAGSYSIAPRHGFFVVHCVDRPIVRVLYRNAALDTLSLPAAYDRNRTGWAIDSAHHQLIISINDPFSPADIEIDLGIDNSKPAAPTASVSVDVVSNPTQGSIRWNVYSPTDTDIRSTISTVTGAVVYQSSDHAFAGENLFSPNGTVFTPGTYELVVTGKGWSVTKKVIVLSR